MLAACTHVCLVAKVRLELTAGIQGLEATSKHGMRACGALMNKVARVQAATLLLSAWYHQQATHVPVVEYACMLTASSSKLVILQGHQHHPEWRHAQPVQPREHFHLQGGWRCRQQLGQWIRTGGVCAGAAARHAG